MKAITIYQPWASLIMVGAKPFEFRGWSPRVRGPSYAALIGQRIVIHASNKRIDVSECMDLRHVLKYGTAEDQAETCLHADKAIPILERAIPKCRSSSCKPLPLSVGLGTVILGEPRNGLDIAEEFGLPRVNDSDRDEHANYGWPMLDVEVWDEPVPMRGYQGFWNWPTPEGSGL